MTSDGQLKQRSSADPEARVVLDLVSAVADLTLVVGEGRRVETVVINPQSSLATLATGWEGQPLSAIFAEESWSKLSQRLESPESALPLELNHAGAVQYEFPVRYTLRRWPGTDKLLMLGRDLRPMAEVQQQLVQAHRAIGRDHEAQRELETRLSRADGRELVPAADHLGDDGADRGLEQQCRAAVGRGAE